MPHDPSDESVRTQSDSPHADIVSLPPAEPEREAQFTSPSPVAKITVALAAAAAEDLDRTKNITGYSKTDLVNKAIQLYAFVNAELRSGSDLFVRRSDGETHQIKLF